MIKSFSNMKFPHADFERDLKRRQDFVRPFLLACGTRNPKFAGSGITCLQRLILCKGLPDDSVKETLDALRECSSLGLTSLTSLEML